MAVRFLYERCQLDMRILLQSLPNTKFNFLTVQGSCCFRLSSFALAPTLSHIQSVCIIIIIITHVLAADPAVHLVEEEQEESRDNESHSCHEESHSVVTHLVYEET